MFFADQLQAPHVCQVMSCHDPWSLESFVPVEFWLSLPAAKIYRFRETKLKILPTYSCVPKKMCGRGSRCVNSLETSKNTINPTGSIWVNYNDLTGLPHWNNGEYWKSSPNGRTIQVSELL